MYKVKAIYEYSSAHDDDLTFSVGQIITVTEEEDAEWLVGEYTDDAGSHHEGLFPRNFVEKYEPVAPPRPVRARTKRDSEIPTTFSPAAIHVATPAAAVEVPVPPLATPASPTAAASFVPAPQSPEEAPNPVKKAGSKEADDEVPKAPKPLTAGVAPPTKSVEPAPPVSPPVATKVTETVSPPPSAASKPVSPPVSEKPSGNSFRDRIAAFNKAAAPPITPYKPTGLGSGSGSNFIKKPFVAPPPSRHAFVPPPRDVPAAKVYRRDEDPEIKKREAENLESAEKAGLVPGSSSSVPGGENGESGDEEHKPMMSLKERMARLQKEQQEQAQRHAEAAAKKEKPKRPPKKRLESFDSLSVTASSGAAAGSEEAQLPPLERKSTSDNIGRRSIEESYPTRMPHLPRRKPSKDTGSAEAQDGNDADMSGAGDTTEGPDDELTERDDSDEISRRPSRTIPIVTQDTEKRSVDRGDHEDVANEEEETEEHAEETEAAGGEADEEADKELKEADASEEEEEETDPEARRREELRARMAKMSGGMGMMGMHGMQGMFGAPAPPAPKRTKSSVAEEAVPTSHHAPPVPAMMALPGMVGRRSEDKSVEEDGEEEEDDVETPGPLTKEPPVASPLVRGSVPPIPGSRAVPPPPPPPASAADLRSPSEGSVSDDELSEQHMRQDSLLDAPHAEPPKLPPPPPQPLGGSQRAATDVAAPTSSTSLQNKRTSRLPPPIPGAAAPPPPPPVQARPPPPPPPGSLSRQSTADMQSPLSPSKSQPPPPLLGEEDDEEDEEVTEYEGDYDTDIANPVSHKNSLKAHARDSSLEDNLSLTSPVLEKTLSFPPPVPNASRAPPPIPNQPPLASGVSLSQPLPRPSLGDKRRSVDVPRSPPPHPPPPPGAASHLQGLDEEYNPYNHAGQPASPGNYLPGLVASTPTSFIEESYAPPDLSLSLSGASSLAATATRGGSLNPKVPPPPPPGAPAPGPVVHSGRGVRQSMDLSRGGVSGVRRSLDVVRPSMESSHVANDLDLAPHSGWWLQPNGLPPQLQGRKDIFFESEQSQSAKRDGKVEINRYLYILYTDYSQTVISARFNPADSTEVHLEQRHEPPPRSLRQDQLEQSYERFGRHVADTVLAKKDSVVGDGKPQTLVLELIKPFRDALLPVGTRAYGALVYSNLANASTSQQDEIRAGDIITLRNAKFQGKHGAMHAKYSMEVGKPDHVAVVGEWDGTKKKVRAWEQGRESKKVKLESYKLDDLRSGEVKIWRVMPRSWVGWEGQN
ncbi:hypothetical protein SEPCBS57363_003907 [Sporothrix epigloea]|uniref:SH3 domain-containing protein n=1 Tax=Sporothrix epigloea TaxID=1892477 RepID=A0ABP0DP52_9PEZI